MTTKISVIIPVYNTEKYIWACLSSLYKQSLKEFEIICINDGSTDISLEILKKYAKIDSRIRIISQVNQGPSVARNVGISIAKGKYIQFIDSDDMLESNALEYSFRKMENEQLDIFYFDGRSIFESHELKQTKSSYKTYYQRDSSYQMVMTGKQLFVKLMHDEKYRVQACLQMIRKDFLIKNKVTFIPGILQEDNAFTTELMLRAKRVCHENKPFYIRRLRKNSIMTKTPGFANAYGYFRCVMALAKYFMDMRCYPEVIGSLQQFCHNLLRSMENIYSKSSVEEREKISTLSLNEQSTMYYLMLYQRKIAQVTAEFNQIKRRHELKSKQYDELTKKIQALVENNRLVEDEIQTFTARNRVLSEKNRILSKKNDELIKKVQSLVEKNHLLEEKVQLSTVKNRSLLEQNHMLENKRRKFFYENNFLTEKCHILIKKNDELTKKNILLLQKVEYIEVHNQNLANQIIDLRNDIANLNTVLNQVQEDFQHMQHSVSFKIGRCITYVPRKCRDWL